MPHRIFSLPEVADYLHLSPGDVETLVRRSEIPFEKKGAKVTFRGTEIDAWASRRILGSKEKSHEFHARSSVRPLSLAKEHAIIPDLIKRNWVEPSLKAKTKAAALREMVNLADATGLLNDKVELADSLKEREKMCSTALAGGVALLHPRHHKEYLFEEAFVVFGRTTQPIPFGSPDGMTTDLFFLVCSQNERLHLHILARLCVLCYQTSLLLDLREATGAEPLYDILVAAEQEVIRHL